MSEPESEPVGKRGPELGMAGVLAAIALVVIGDSLRVGIGWADDGPRAGYFPFYIGGLLLAASLAIVVGELRRWRQPDPPFAERAQLRSVVAVLLPMVAYVALIWGLGIYLASALLIGYFMRRHGQYRWPLTVAVSVGVPLLLFAVFEKWFLVPLPKGPIEHLLGL
ncbi:tripartite tricarboxylate transporter TctB family protein [Rhizobacter sp. SG703]|uniref:tripartite tricarboxylate transporter TctB family protein n=1 Tax=Rhizobacter sp. SG703 TaxID=2587140 RepID=UPI0014454E1F|nr:tripartite tricarboxylate transporter TctB family protein [Rhizobacter sp. SG703]NKI94254.1 O-antigen/teichoic acid export membrane protein [Rhizobacter sp. SG703]